MRFLAILAMFIGLTAPAYSQVTSPESVIGYLSTTGCPGAETVCFMQYGAGLPVSIGGFTALTTGTPISASTVSATGTLPAGAEVVVTNVGAVAAYCNLGATAATTNSQYIPPSGAWFGFAVGSATQISCITASSTTTLNLTGGSGIPTGTGGGGGGGGGGNVNITGLNGSAPSSSNPLYVEDPRLTFSGNNAEVLEANSAAILTAAQAPLAAQASFTVNIGAVTGLTANNTGPNGNPLEIAGLAQNSEPSTLASSGQISVPSTDLVHRLIVYPYANKENEVTSGAVVLTASTASTSAIGVPGSGLYNYVTDIACFNSGTSSSTLLVQNGSAGATIFEGYAAANGGGFVVHFDTPIGGANHMTVNTAVYIQAGTSTSSMICNLQGFKGS